MHAHTPYLTLDNPCFRAARAALGQIQVVYWIEVNYEIDVFVTVS